MNLLTFSTSIDRSRFARKRKGVYEGDVCYCTERGLVPFAGHYAVDKGKPNPKLPVRWVEASDDPNDPNGHWEFL